MTSCFPNAIYQKMESCFELCSVAGVFLHFSLFFFAFLFFFSRRGGGFSPSVVSLFHLDFLMSMLKVNNESRNTLFPRVWAAILDAHTVHD